MSFLDVFAGPGLPGLIIYQGNPSISSKRTPMLWIGKATPSVEGQGLRGRGGGLASRAAAGAHGPGGAESHRDRFGGEPRELDPGRVPGRGNLMGRGGFLMGNLMGRVTSWGFLRWFWGVLKS